LRVSSESAREKKHQNYRAGLRRMQRRGKKSVILALRYFSAAARDVLRILAVVIGHQE
jgi:hypothetical protein